MKKFRKKPIVVEAMQFDGTYDSAVAIVSWASTPFVRPHYWSNGQLFGVTIESHYGQTTAHRDDWVIKGVNGEFYPCPPIVFAETYERLEK